jgi:imidazolonepropionase-like amidohydrolase
MESSTKPAIAFYNGTLIDGNGSDPLPNTTILLKGNRIEKIGNNETVAIPDDAEKFDVSGNYILPGLMDAHVHLVAYAGPGKIDSRFWKLESPPSAKALHAYKNARQTLLAGFTTVRNAGNVTQREPEDIVLRDAIRQGIVDGPKILASGGGVSMTAGHGALYHPPFMPVIPELGLGDSTADGPDEVRKAVRQRMRLGADFIKIYTSGGVATSGDKSEWNNWTMSEIKAATEEAHGLGRRVASHAQGLQGIKNAVAGGADTIEHACILDEEAIEMMIKSGTYISSTLIVLRTIALNQGKFPASEEAIEKAKAVTDIHFKSIGLAHRAGVKIVFATDTFNLLRHGENASEFSCLLEAGLTPMEAIQAATRNAAEAFDLIDDRGTLEEGKIADLLITGKDPLANIRTLEDLSNIKIVVKNGETVARR